MACEAFAIAAAICAAWALWERHKRHHVARLHLAAAARLHESQRTTGIERRRVALLIAKLARITTKLENLTQTATEVAMLAQLDALWQDVRKVDDVPAGEEA